MNLTSTEIQKSKKRENIIRKALSMKNILICPLTLKVFEMAKKKKKMRRRDFIKTGNITQRKIKYFEIQYARV